MTKIAKIIAYGFLSILEYVLIFIIAFAFFIRTEFVQTFLAQKAASYLSEMLETTVSIKRVSITFIDKAFIDGVLILDQHNDTLLYTKELVVKLSDFNLSNTNIELDKVRLTSSTVKLIKYANEDYLNFQFIVEAFKQEKDTLKDPADFSIHVAKFELIDSRFVFNNQHVLDHPKGIDFSHLDISKLNLSAADVHILPSSYAANILQLSAHEKSGFVLDNLATRARFDNTGARLSDLTIDLPKSRLNARDFQLNVNELADFNKFIDKVRWDVKLDASTISFEDIAHFAPALWGMDAVVAVQGEITEAISGLRLSNFVLETGDSTLIKGDFVLPDFRILNDEIWLERIEYLHVDVNDIQGLRLPDSSGARELKLPAQLLNLRYIEGRELTLRGNVDDVTVSLNRLNTGLGVLTFDENLRIYKDLQKEGYYFTSTDSRKNYIHFEMFDLGKLLDVAELGFVDGAFGFDAKFIAEKSIAIKGIHGVFKRFDAAGYSYANINIAEADYELSFEQTIPKSTINGYIRIRDENLDLTYLGKLEIQNNFKMDLFLDIECAHLDQLHTSLEKRGELISKMKITGSGTSLNDFEGGVKITDLTYQEKGESFDIDKLDAEVYRNTKGDSLFVKSDVVDLDFRGVVDLDKIGNNIMYQVTQVFPAFFNEMKPTVDPNSKFTYTIEVKNLNPILNVFYPEIQVAEGMMLSGGYTGLRNSFDLTIQSDFVAYQDYYFRDIYMFQELYDGQLLALYDIRQLSQGDSLAFQNLHFTNIAYKSFMDANLQFDDASSSRSNIEWHTFLHEKDAVDIDILPSYFTFNNHRWDLEQKAHINYSGECFLVENFELHRLDQYISANGQLSKHESDKLNISIKNLDLEDFGKVFLDNLEMRGIANVDGFVSDPFENFAFDGTATIDKFFLDQREIGDVIFSAKLNSEVKRMEFDGELIYKNSPTFNFNGDYWYQKKVDNLDFDLIFRRTDISVLNTFLDPNVVSDIKGKLVGNFKLSGSIAEPVFDGKVNINNGNVKVGLLGTTYKYNGVLTSDDFGILVDHMPITDEEGNTGSLTAMISHNNFKNFDYDIHVNMEEHPTLRNPIRPAEPLMLDRFMVLKTQYEEGSVYYGNAYVTGSVNISGYNELMNISVNAKTKRGTWIDFPMYGPTTVSEDGFITFKSAEATEEQEEKKIDFSGVKMSLNFDITPDARVKLIFDPNIGDEITASGSGKINLGLDKYGDLTMDGTYTLSDGMYNFALGPYKQNFFITPGGTIQWMGTPYDAQLDVRTYYKTVANLTAVMPDVVENRASDNEEIYSYLILTGDMNKPEISFDMEAPKATEAGKAVMNRIRSDQDELNRQFFSIMIMKRFLPLAGQESRGGAGGNALVDLVSTQINSILSKVSDEYRMKVDIDSDDVTGEGSVEFGVSKGFFDDKLLVSTSFGVGNQGTANDGAIIGDVSVEYLLNEDGTFRVNVFSRSNTNNALQQNQQGPLTQGIGINYKEDFHNMEDFKLIQFIFDVFRKEENRKVMGKGKEKKLTPIPQNKIDQNAIKEEEE
jgi:hypothetical protein